MDTRQPFIISLADAYDYPTEALGNKARNLSLCMKKGFKVPAGFCISSSGYLAFIEQNGLQPRIDLELYRKDFSAMRWEEIWDAALRIRSQFLKGVMPSELEQGIKASVAGWPEGTKFAVRSSSGAEDSAAASFAGIHESYLNIDGDQLLETVKMVWASLWSDRSLLYREQKKLDSRQSTMPVLVQVMEPGLISGLAFSADPSSGRDDLLIIELISGSLDQLVDNIKEPERIKLLKQTGELLSDGRSGKTTNLITNDVLEALRIKILALEKIFGKPVDVEWTGFADNFTVLQVRPITSLENEPDDERAWYLTLTPGKKSLLALTEKVEKVLIPKLIEEVERFGSEGPFPEDDQTFNERIRQRGASYQRWKKTYKDDFIPFAHGIRTFGTYYNDLIKPEDPYEFIKLLKSDDLLAFKRNKELKKLAEILREDLSLQKNVKNLLGKQKELDLDVFLDKIKLESAAGDFFASGFKKLLAEEMNVYYENTSLADDPAGLLKNLLVLALHEHKGGSQVSDDLMENRLLEQTFLEKAGPKKQDEALNWLRVGRLSWKLRDDDNVLMGKLENQLYLYLKEAIRRLQETDMLTRMPEQIALDDWQVITESLLNGKSYDPPPSEIKVASDKKRALKPRQLVGQPSSGGLVTGKARVIRSVADFKDVAAGEILVFDAVQPQMTFIITLAAGIIERRGGMLVHSSIIARELRIPSVNGVSRATELIETGDLVTLNGDLGLVIIGEPEFDLEHSLM